MSRGLLAATLLAITAGAARADAAPPDEPRAAADVLPEAAPAPSTARRLAAIGAAIVPGVVVRGAGSWVIGERRTARRLLTTAAIGLGAMAIGGVAVGVSGASDYTIIPGVPLVIVGAGLVLPTWFADIWVAAGGERVVAAPHALAPWSLEGGTTWLRDPYRDRALVRTAARVQLGRLGLGAASLIDARGDAQTGELEARWRLLGAAATGQAIPDGSSLVVRAATRIHRDDADDVTLLTGEVEVIARVDLRRLERVLADTFVELSTGLGVERATYARATHDTASLLLGRFAWGAYLGTRSELAVFYDHRRDSLAGGFPAWRASGFFGSFGATAELRIAGPWAVLAELEVGNAWVSTLAVRYHGGTP